METKVFCARPRYRWCSDYSPSVITNYFQERAAVNCSIAMAEEFYAKVLISIFNFVTFQPIEHE